MDSPRGGINALKFSGRSEKSFFRNLLPNTLGRGDADTSWAYSGMGAGLSKSAFGAKNTKLLALEIVNDVPRARFGEFAVLI